MSHFFVGSFLNQDLLNIMLLVQEKRFWLGHVGPTPSRQLNKSMLGDCGRQGLLDFWEHLRGMEEWSEHPVVNDPNVDKGSLYLSSPILFSYRVCAKASIKAGSDSYPIKFCVWELGYPGLIPASFHVDGVEFFTNAEYVVWSMSSGIALGNVLISATTNVLAN